MEKLVVLKDKNGLNVYAGDTLEVDGGSGFIKGEVVYDKNSLSFMLKCDGYELGVETVLEEIDVNGDITKIVITDL